jgi:hypothetical protein
MASLEDVIEELKQLDSQRLTAATLREGGDAFIRRRRADTPAAGMPSPNLDLVATATLLRALRTRLPVGLDEHTTSLIKELHTETSEYLMALDDRPEGPRVHGSEQGHRRGLPLFVAARVLQALVTIPGEGLSRTALLCYYHILRAFYTAEAPDFTTGGVSAGASGASMGLIRIGGHLSKGEYDGHYGGARGSTDTAELYR